jgi:putative hemolysin
MDPQPFFILLAAIIASAFFSGIEMAFVSANRLYFELQAKQGVVTGQIIAGFFKHPSRFIGTMLVGNTLALVVYGIFMQGYLHDVLAPLLPEVLQNEVVLVLIPALIAAILILATAEFTPKSLFLLNPDGFLEVLAIPIWLVYWAMYPLVTTIVGITRWFIVNILRFEYVESRQLFGMTDLTQYLGNINAPEGRKEEVDEVDTKIFNNALEFRQVRVRDCMIPRTDIVAVDLEDSMDSLRRTFVDSGHSKVLIYRDTIEDVVGYCHQLALFKKPKEIKAILSPILIVPEAMPAQDLLVRFTQERKSVALVVDEFGGTSGLVSLEDLIEKIFGEIQDEYDDHEDWVEKQLDDKTYLLSARHEVSYLNKTYGWNLPEGDYDTLGGLILTVNQDVPVLNEVIEVPPFTLTVLSMQDARIDTVRLVITGDLPEKRPGKSKETTRRGGARGES